MIDIDKQIREALAAEDAELFAQIEGDQSLFQMVGESFRGRHRWLVTLVYLSMTVFLILTVASAVQFFRAYDVRDMLFWIAAFFFCLLAVAANKLWYWMELNKNAVTREVKRLELQIAQLSRRLSEKQGGA